jgi:hypothetical protein
MKSLAKLVALAALSGLSVSHAAVKYVGNTADADVATVINLNTDPTATYGGTYDADTKTWTWSASDTFVLQELIFITNGTLVIESGSIVRGQPRVDSSTFNVGALVIARTAKIIADGTSDQPIIFTTASTDTAAFASQTGFRATGPTPIFWDSAPKTAPKSAANVSLWGGLVILGNAPVNVDRDGGFTSATANTNFNAVGTNAKGTVDQIYYGYGSGTNKDTFSGLYNDGTTFSNLQTTVIGDDRPSIEGIPTASGAYTGGFDRYGGFNVDDNSGILRYISLRHDGANLSNNNELNGLTLGGVGKGTTLSYIEIWGSSDDGIEIFGGNCNLDHVAVFGFQDDGLDLDVGYTGTIQFALVVGGNFSDKLGEWDGSYENESGTNRPNGFAVDAPASATRTPIANFIVANATLIGNPAVTDQNPQGTVGITDGSMGLMIRDQSSPRLLNSIMVNPRNTNLPIIVNSRVTTQNATFYRYDQGLAWMRGCTFWSDSSITAAPLMATNNITLNSTVTNWVAGAPSGTLGGAVTKTATTFANSSGTAATQTAIVASALGATANGNLFQSKPGFKKLPSTAAHGAFPNNFALNPVPGSATADAGSADAVFDDLIGFYNDSIEVVTYRGAFDNSDLTSPLWTNAWTAANRTGFLVSKGTQ